MGNRQADQFSICSDADSAPGCCGEHRAEPESKARDLPVDFPRSYPHL